MHNVNQMFHDALEAYEAWNDGDAEPTIDVDDEEVEIGKFFGRLWNCRDFMPNDLREQVIDHIHWTEKQHNMNTLSRFSQAARIMKMRVDEAKGVYG